MPETLRPPSPEAVDRLLRVALDEDLAEAGDVTSRALIPEAARARAVIVAEEPLVLAGVDGALRTFTLLDPSVRRTGGRDDGSEIQAGEAVLTVEGPARALLSGERTALNLLGRLCGVASRTRAVVRRVEGARTQVFDTRKTTPGLRELEKYAVRCGGGRNHRMGLHDMALIKENHIALVGGVGEAVRRARRELPAGMPVEVEVQDLEGLDEALVAGADLVLMDHAGPELLQEAMRRAAGRAVIEASGGIGIDDLAGLARTTGVDRISLGTLTRDAVWCDLSMDVDVEVPG